MMSEERLQILKMVEEGKLSTEQAIQLLDALNGQELPEELEYVEEPEMVEDPPTPAADLPSAGNWWLYPTAAGAVVMAIGAPLVALGLTGKAALFWAIFCGWIPFFIGLAILTLGVWSRTARWIHIRIDNRDGARSFALGFPLPLTLSAWVVRMMRPFVPQLRETAVDEAILALRDGMREGEDQPVYIDVQDDEDGEQVRIQIV
jgi:hypothetical protein